jgi:hypothetical protein
VAQSYRFRFRVCQPPKWSSKGLLQGFWGHWRDKRGKFYIFSFSLVSHQIEFKGFASEFLTRRGLTLYISQQNVSARKHHVQRGCFRVSGAHQWHRGYVLMRSPKSRVVIVRWEAHHMALEGTKVAMEAPKPRYNPLNPSFFRICMPSWIPFCRTGGLYPTVADPFRLSTP